MNNIEDYYKNKRVEMEFNRQEFLKFVGIAVLVVVGIVAIIVHG